jgi:LmbE family N-acetylglucosaminyl deacetylase/GT2 family glycosyltransferase
MKCSVIIPTYNRAELLALTLHSLTLQDLDSSEFEVLVVDDGSADNTYEVVESYVTQLQIRYLFQQDLGYRVARARNLGIIGAEGPICVLVDAGVLLSSGCLRTHCQAHQENREPVAICGYVYGLNQNNEDAELIRCQIDVGEINRTVARFSAEGLFPDLREEFYAKYGDDFNYLPAPWVVFWTCNVSVRKDLLHRVGLFDEGFNTWGGEDVELAYRLHRAGCRFEVARAAAAIHYPHEKSYGHNMAEAHISYTYFAEKYGTPITALVVTTDFWDLNDVIRIEGLPNCEDYLKTRDGQAISFLPDGRSQNDICSKTVFVFAPHPGDEVIAAGATICSHHESGHRVFIVFSTNGFESGAAVLDIHSNANPEELADIWKGEALAAARTMNVPAENVIFLSFQDRQLAFQRPALAAAILSLLKEHPDLETVYCPDPDRELNENHRVTGAAVISVLEDLQRETLILRYVVWDKEFEDTAQFPHRVGGPVSIGDAEEVRRTDTARFNKRKLSAMAQYKTQVEFSSKTQVRSTLPVLLMNKISCETLEEFRVHTLPTRKDSEHRDAFVGCSPEAESG